MSAEPEAVSTAASQAGKHDAAVALRNGFRLGLSLLATWSVALAVRFQLPRHLGPELFGRYNFSDALTGTFFTFLSFGIGTYIMREIAVRPQHASDFFGGLLVLRGALGVLALGLVAGFLALSPRPAGLQSLVFVFGLFYLVNGVNGYLSNILQASTKVGALATVNVASKLIWGAGLVLAIWLDAPLYALALPNLLAEIVKLVVLLRAARDAVGLRLRIDYQATRLALVASLPFFANSIAVELGGRVDITMLEFLAPGPEVGWYSAANNFASLAIMLSPVIGWVVMPLLARAHARSEEEFFGILRTAMRALIVLAIPGAMAIALGAEIWVEIAFGSSFGPAISAVRVLAFMFVATYVAILLSVSLIILQRSWTLTTVSVVSLLVEIALIPLGVYLLRHTGDGGAANGAALGFAGAELATVLILSHAVGKRAFDRTLVTAVLKSLFLCGITTLGHRALIGIGPWRLLVDLAFYVLAAFAIGAVSWPEAVALVQTLLNRKSGGTASEV